MKGLPGRRCHEQGSLRPLPFAEAGIDPGGGIQRGLETGMPGIGPENPAGPGMMPGRVASTGQNPGCQRVMKRRRLHRAKERLMGGLWTLGYE